MSAVLRPRGFIQARIDICKAQQEVDDALRDLMAVDWRPGECTDIDITFADRRSLPICYASAIPREAYIAGLQAMKAALEAMLEKT